MGTLGVGDWFVGAEANGDGAIVFFGVAYCLSLWKCRPCLARVLSLWFFYFCSGYPTLALAFSELAMSCLSCSAGSFFAPFALALVLQQCAYSVGAVRVVSAFGVGAAQSCWRSSC